MAFLTTQHQAVVNHKYEIKRGVTTIGRHPDCDIVVDDNSISRRHAQITYRNGQYYLCDLNSRNGTLLNKTPVEKDALLFDNSLIEICDVDFIFHVADDFSHARPRPTGPERHLKAASPIFAFDDKPAEQSSILQSVDVSSHYSASGTRNEKGPAGEISALKRKLHALITVTRALSEAHDQQAILQKVLECLFDLFVDADRGFIVLRDEEGEIVPYTMKTRHERDAEKIRISRTIVNRVLESKQAILSSDATADQRFDLSQSIVDFRIRSLMCAPLMDANDVAIGAIQLDTLRSSIVFDEGDLDVLVTATMQASLALQNVRLFAQLERNNQLEHDLKLAHEVQQRFLPQQYPILGGCEFFSYYRPMTAVGGDYYDFVQLDEHRLAIIVADVVGHGLAAAMLMAKISAESRFALALNSSPVDATMAVNRALSSMNVDKFVTMLLGMVDIRDHSVTFVNAGHMRPILIRANGEVEELTIRGSGLPLGVLDETSYGSHRHELKSGDSIVFYTDGVNEAMNESNEQLGIQNVLKELRASQSKSVDAIGNSICQTVRRHVGSHEQIDDICVVAFSYHPRKRKSGDTT